MSGDHNANQKPTMSSKFKKLTKVKLDIDFVDPNTMQKVCSLNQCINKFDSVVEETHKRIKLGVEFDLVQQHHVCNECGRKYASHTDKHINYRRFFEACIENKIPLSSPRRQEEL
jgi:hypothetical protein